MCYINLLIYKYLARYARRETFLYKNGKESILLRCCKNLLLKYLYYHYSTHIDVVVYLVLQNVAPQLIKNK